MTTRRKTARRPGPTSARPRLTWRLFEHEGLTLTGGTVVTVNMAVDGVAATLASLGVVGDYTIRRVRWTLGLWDTDAEVTLRMVTVYWGMTVVSDDAVASGSGAMADPRVDSADWFGYGTPMYSVAPAGADSPDQPRLYEYDVRSMRKVNENNQVPVLRLSMIAGETALYQVAGRVLVSHGRR